MPRLLVEVVRALAESQEVVVLHVEAGATAGEAVAASGLVAAGRTSCLGIGGRRVGPGERLRDGDRVELLRPLAADPKEARRRRARKRMPR